MSVRSADMMPKDWAAKAPEYIVEAQELGVRIRPPSVQKSHLGFHIVNEGEIYFGLNGIRSCGKTASMAVINARANIPFQDINDFISRVNTQKVNTKVFESLVYAGAFDTMGYLRQDLLENIQVLYDYKTNCQEYYERLQEIKNRETENENLIKIVERRNELKKLQLKKSGRELTTEELEWLQETDGTRKKVTLKVKELPTLPELTRHKSIPIDLIQMMKQQEYIGCFLGKHPARLLFPEAEALVNAYEGIKMVVCGMVSEIRDFKTKAGQQMAMLEIGDGTASAKVLLFPRDYQKVIRKGKLPTVRQMIKVTGKISKEAPVIEIFAETIDIHRG